MGLSLNALFKIVSREKVILSKSSRIILTSFLYTKDGDNKLYKYFGGLPDLIYEKDGVEELIEVKSKELVKKQYVENNPPKTEIMQGKNVSVASWFG